jgi:hypothetical protein
MRDVGKRRVAGVSPIVPELVMGVDLLAEVAADLVDQAGREPVAADFTGLERANDGPARLLDGDDVARPEHFIGRVASPAEPGFNGLDPIEQRAQEWLAQHRQVQRGIPALQGVQGGPPGLVIAQVLSKVADQALRGLSHLAWAGVTGHKQAPADLEPITADGIPRGPARGWAGGLGPGGRAGGLAVGLGARPR